MWSSEKRSGDLMTKFKVEDQVERNKEGKIVPNENGDVNIQKGSIYIIRWLPTKIQEEIGEDISGQKEKLTKEEKEQERLEKQATDRLESVTYSNDFTETVILVKDAVKQGINRKNMQIFRASFEEEGYSLTAIDPWDLWEADILHETE